MRQKSSPTKKKFAGRIVMVPFAIVVSIFLIISAASNFSTTLNPGLAIVLNPLNTPARILKITSRLSGETDADETDLLKETALQGIRYDPLYAKLYSLLGVTYERQNKLKAAQSEYTRALKLLPTEIHALERRFFFNLSTANYVKAISQVDIILRAWPSKWKDIEPYIPQLLRDKGAYNEVLKLISATPFSRYAVIRSLNKDLKSASIARHLIRDWHAQGIEGLQNSINTTTEYLIQFKDYLNAYRLFVLTLSKEQQKYSGYVFDGSFELTPKGNEFDWKIPNQAGMVASFKKTRNGNGSNPDIEDVLMIRFLDAPVRFSKSLQSIVLPPSNFTLKLTYSTDHLKTKKPIKMRITCRENNKELVSFPFKSGNNSKSTIEIKFSVPSSNCGLQQIQIFNDNFVESWKNRYSGMLLLHNIAISLDGV